MRGLDYQRRVSALNKKLNGRMGVRTPLLGAGLLVTIPVLAVGGGGGGLSTGAYIGPLPSEWFQDEPCHDEAVVVYEDQFILEYQVDVARMRDDGDPNTWVKCTTQSNGQALTCNVGLADGSVLGCRDSFATQALPRDGHVVYMQFDPIDTVPCNIQVGTGNSFGVADPKCRSGGDGDGDGDGDGAPGVCDASTAAAVLTTGQSTNIASNACVQLKNETGWSTIDPHLQALAGTAAYPVPLSYTSCGGNGSASFAGDWQSVYLVDGVQGAQTNPGCDIFVQLQGDGSQVSFRYYE